MQTPRSERTPLEHIQRPRIPWRRTGHKTECGRPIESVGASITFAEFQAKYKREGQQRSALTTCMTCWNRSIVGARIREDWQQRPSSVVSRDCNDYSDGDDQIDQELRALAALVAAHEEEFYGYLDGLADTVSLADRRERRRLGGGR